MKAYKVVKVLRNGSRVSTMIPNWSPLYKVYIHNGIKKIVDSGFLFSLKGHAIDWAEDQKNHDCQICAEIKPYENLEVWEVEFKGVISRNKVVSPLYLIDKETFSDFYRKFKTDFEKMIIAANSRKQTTKQIEASFIAKNIILTQKIH